MDPAVATSQRFSEADLRRLDGCIVLVESASDQRTPPTGLRGTLAVRPDGRGGCKVMVTLGFPQMFTAEAHQRTIVLADDDVAALLASERNGAFELVVRDRLDPAATSGNE